LYDGYISLVCLLSFDAVVEIVSVPEGIVIQKTQFKLSLPKVMEDF